MNNRNNFFKSVWLRESLSLTANRFKNKQYVSRTVCSPFFPSPRAIPTHPHSYSLFRRPFTGCYNKFYEKGTYTCIVCDQELFSSDTKYDSGCGWPAFNEVLDQGRIKLTKDTSHGKRLRSSLAYLLQCILRMAFFGHIYKHLAFVSTLNIAQSL